ncbi:MAG: beta-ketoacyl-[acyl-carrier-protein] synthase II [Anaerolineaceae bacterium 4572_32.1]|nr:MAG: beta-ketoacyl-[acyl-carrier-protein] synthase II [Anaerolineaceae bacterium 4572_32.1]
MTKRVVITGIGAITSVGLDMPSTWAALLEGKSGAGPITLFDASQFDVQFAAEIKNFEPLNYMDRKTARRSDRVVQIALAATAEALRQAGLEITDEIADDVGVIVGTGIGGEKTHYDQISILLERGPRRVSSFALARILPDMPAGQISISYGPRGPNHSVSSACATGADSLGEAFEIIRRGDALAVIAGGTESCLAPSALAAFDRSGVLAHYDGDPREACRPFDATRNGLLMGEGAVILILEDLDFARRRGAKPLAELVGYGATADAFHISAPSEEGMGAAKAIWRALRKAGLEPEDIDYIHAHGTGTRLNDHLETLAVKHAFGEHAYRLPLSSTKSMTGHMMGAAGAIGAAVAVMAIRENKIPPTINLHTPDPECDLDYVPNRARETPVRAAMVNAFGFGGHNAVLVIKEM